VYYYGRAAGARAAAASRAKKSTQHDICRSIPKQTAPFKDFLDLSSAKSLAAEPLAGMTLAPHI
jgi:hypothetical protein